MKDFATALYEKVRSSPKTRFQRTWQEAQTWSQSNRTGCQEQLYVPFTSVGKTKPYKYAHHTLSGKKDYTTGKTTRLHSEKSKQTIEADCRFGSEISNYLSTALKGWDVWVGNKVREHIILT